MGCWGTGLAGLGSWTGHCGVPLERGKQNRSDIRNITKKTHVNCFCKLDKTTTVCTTHLAFFLHHLSVFSYKETYVSCLRSFLCGLGSWTHCCCGGTMGDFLASCCLLRREQGRDCPAHVPETPAATETHTTQNKYLM